MAFSFPKAQLIWSTAAWATFLDGRSSNPSGKIARGQLVEPLEMEMNVEILRRVVQTRNPTQVGSDIFKDCKSNEKKIHFIGWRMRNGGLPGFSSFENDCPRPGEATIYVNLDLTLQVQSPKDSNPKKILNGYIILLHELGHARHWLKFGSARFDTMVAKNESRSQRVSAAEAEVREVIMQGKGAYSTKRQLIEDAVLKKVGHADYYGKHFPNDLELLNWIEHEGPICDKWGIARRPAYTAIKDVW